MLKNNGQLSFADPLKATVFYTLASFFMLHFFGIFGFFMALSYPLWWFFIPQRTLCFFCLHISILHRYGTCPVCKRKVTTIYDPPFKSILYNMLAIIVLSTAALFIIMLEVHFLSKFDFIPFLSPSRAEFLIPEKNTVPLDSIYTFEVEIRNPQKPVNVIQADMKFDPTIFEVKEIYTDQSFATVFVQKDFSNREGWIRIIGGTLNPGFVGEKGQFVKIYFKPKSTGIGQIQFLNSSKILAADGKGTNLLTSFRSTTVVVTAPTHKVSSGNGK